MEETDRQILRHTLAVRVGKAVSEAIAKERNLEEDVYVMVGVTRPACYIDDAGETHSGHIVIVDVEIADITDGEDY